MNRTELDTAVSGLIQKYEALYEEYKHDTYYSTSYHSAFETLQQLSARLQSGLPPETLLTDLQSELPELIELRERESDHPTFDWYDEHHYYKLYDGQLDAYKEMIRLLEEYMPD